MPMLQSLLFHLTAMRFVQKIFVMPKGSGFKRGESSEGGSEGGEERGGEDGPLARLIASWNVSADVAVEVLPGGSFSMLDRMRPVASMPTDCLLLWDDSVMVAPSVLQASFKFWMVRQ